MWQVAIELGVGAMFGLPFLKAAVKSSPKIVGMIHDHFTRHNDVLGEAWVESYGKAVYALSEGVGNASWWDRTTESLRSNLQSEFRQNIQHKYLLAFQQQAHVSGEKLKNLRTAAGEILKNTGEITRELYPKERWPKEIDVARIFDSPTQNQEIERALLNDILSQASTTAVLRKYNVSSAEIERLLRFESMLLSAVLYFFRDQLLNDQRIKSAMDALRQQGFHTDIKHLFGQIEAQRGELEAQRAQQAKALEQQAQQHQETQASLRALEQRLTETTAQIIEAAQVQNFGVLASLNAQAQETKAAQEQQRAALEQVTQALEKQQVQLHEIESSLSRIEQDNQRFREEMQREFDEAKAVWGGFERQLQGFGESLGELREELRVSFAELQRKIDDWKRELETRLDRLEKMLEKIISTMGAHGLPDNQVTIAHEMTVYPKQTTFDIETAYQDWLKLPMETTPHYTKLSLRMGTSLSSMGALEQAESCFEAAARHARDRFENPSDHHAQEQARKDLALANYNLHQIFLRQGALERALTAIKEASRLEPAEYMPFNMSIYDAQRILGAGGMGCAFLCQHPLNKKHVVVKTFWKAKEGKLQEVFSEAYKMQEADPEGVFIPRPLEIGYGDPLRNRRPFLVMEYIEGSLDGEQYLEKHGPLSFQEGVRLGAQVAEALARAHARNICHFDLKPANLLFYKEGREWMVKIIDFGLARAAHSLRDELAKQHSRSSQRSVLATTAFGTMVYAPPEQLQPTPQRQPGPASDIYSFAKTLYRLITGQDAQHFLPPPELQGTEIIKIIERCLQHGMNKRPTAAELKSRFEEMGKGRPEPINPVFYTMAPQFMKEGTLLERDESVLWTLLQSFATPRSLARDALRWSLEQAPARRRAAQRAEGWFAEQTPNLYPRERVWSALQERFPADYSEQGLREVPQTEIADVFRDDPAFVEEDHGIRLLRWQAPFAGETPKEPEEIVEITVGQWVAQVAWAHRLWMRPLRDNEDKMRRSNEYLRLPLSRYRELFALKMNGNFRVDSFCAKVKEICGWSVVILDEKGQRAESQTKIGQIRLSGAKIFGCGDDIYFTLTEGSAGQPPKWLANNVLRSPLLREEGGLLAACASKFRLLSERGEVTAYIKREKDKGKLRSLGAFWALYPELTAGDALCFHLSEPDICRVYVIAQSALVDRPLPAKPTEESIHARAALLAAYAKAKADSSEAIASIETAGGEVPPTTDAESGEVHLTTDAEDGETTATTDAANAQVSSSTTFSSATLSAIPSEDASTSNETDTDEDEDDPKGNEDDNVVDDPPTSEITNNPETQAPSTGTNDQPSPPETTPQPPEAPPTPEGFGGDEEPITVYRKTMEWAVDWGLWIEILDPKTDEPAADHLPLQEVVWKTPKPKEISLTGNQKVKTFVKNVQKATGLKIRLLDKMGQQAADPEAFLGNFWLTNSKWSKVRGKDFFITLKPAKEAGFSPPWRTYGYLSLGQAGYSAISAEDNERIVKLYLEGAEQVFDAKLYADPPRIEKMRAFFREASDLTPGDVLGFVRREDGDFQVYAFARQELLPEPKKPKHSGLKTEADTGSNLALGTEDDEETLTLDDLFQDGDTTQPELDVVSVTDNKAATTHNKPRVSDYNATVADLAIPSMVEMLKMQAEYALRENNLDEAVKAYATLHNKHMAEIETEMPLLQRASAAMQFKRAMEMELEGNLPQAIKLLEAAQALDPTFLPTQIRQKIQNLRNENQHKIKSRFQRMSRDAVQMAQTDPHAALQMLLDARVLAPLYWTPRHQEWLDYLEAVCKSSY